MRVMMTTAAAAMLPAPWRPRGADNARGRTLNEGDACVVKFARTELTSIDTLHSTMKGKVIVE